MLGLPLEPEESGKDKNDKADPCAHSVAGLPAHIRNAEELVCLVYMAFIQNILGRMRSLVMSIICMFIAISVAIASYPFDPRPVLSGMVVVLFFILGTTVVAVYSQMHRDTTLSNLMDTKPGELGGDFWIKLIGFGVGPVLGLVASVFPEFTDFLFSWVQPGLGSLK
jgi:fumarate reductase subunit D